MSHDPTVNCGWASQEELGRPLQALSTSTRAATHRVNFMLLSLAAGADWRRCKNTHHPNETHFVSLQAHP